MTSIIEHCGPRSYFWGSSMVAQNKGTKQNLGVRFEGLGFRFLPFEGPSA